MITEYTPANHKYTPAMNTADAYLLSLIDNLIEQLEEEVYQAQLEIEYYKSIQQPMRNQIGEIHE